MKNLYVGNLPFSTHEQELRQMFEQYGHVEKITLMNEHGTGRFRGFAFLEMTNANEADSAITALNESDLGGRSLKVTEARSKPSSERGFGGHGPRRPHDPRL